MASACRIGAGKNLSRCWKSAVAGPGCLVTFLLCRHCFRGQCYCGPGCRARSRTQQRRVANARHQRSEAGRLDHRDGQRRYRKRLRALRAPRVTDRSSLRPDLASSSRHDVAATQPAVVDAARGATPADLPWRCWLCHRPGIPVGCWLLFVSLVWCSPWLADRCSMTPLAAMADTLGYELAVIGMYLDLPGSHALR